MISACIAFITLLLTKKFLFALKQNGFKSVQYLTYIGIYMFLYNINLLVIKNKI